jgi:hypothetical protein
MAAPAYAGREIGDYRGLPSDLAAAATAFDIAQFRSDGAELRRWLADDYVLLASDGGRQTKAGLIAETTAPGHSTMSVALSKQVRRYWPNGAVLGGIVDARGLDHGKATSTHARFVDVWAKRRGRWQVIFTQMNEAR